MSLYRYQEISDSFFSDFKFIDAESIQSAKMRLKAKNIYIKKILPYQSFRKKFSISNKHLFIFTKDLYYLLASKLPLYESLQTLLDKYRNNKIYPMILDLSDCIKSGKALSSILRQYTKVFNPIYVSMIQAAEKSGQLDTAFLELSELIEQNNLWKQSIKKALIYPTFLLTFSLTILFSLFLFIIPSISELFEERSLHPLTTIILSISNWMCHNISLLSCSFLFFIATFTLCFYQKAFKNFWKKIFYKISFLNNLSTKIAIVRFTSSLYNLLNNNVPILHSLLLAKGSLNHPYLENDIEIIIKKVQKGEKFSKAVSFSKFFPKMVSNMISTGEHSGSLCPVLLQINQLYNHEVKTALDNFTAIIQPFLLLFIGLIIGVVLLAVLIPLTDVSSLL